ncbi:MAG TPA: hypothetical protein VGM25_09160 [Caulobacteraceae bacterium]|jgi:predicted benzoate:H+ symporter BenE
MDDSDFDPDPRRRVPTTLWLMLGLVLVVVFGAAVLMLLGHGPLHAVGPPAGTP